MTNICHSKHKWAATWQNQKMSVRPAKTQISLGIHPVWSESSLSAWRKLGSLATHWAHSEDSGQTGRMSRLIWVFAGRTVLSCRGSNHNISQPTVTITYNSYKSFHRFVQTRHGVTSRRMTSGLLTLKVKVYTTSVLLFLAKFRFSCLWLFYCDESLLVYFLSFILKLIVDYFPLCFDKLIPPRPSLAPFFPLKSNLFWL